MHLQNRRLVCEQWWATPRPRGFKLPLAVCHQRPQPIILWLVSKGREAWGWHCVKPAGIKTLLGVPSAKRKFIGSPKLEAPHGAVPTSHSYRRFLFQLHAPRHSLQLTLELK